jgi:hypothetical protein
MLTEALACILLHILYLTILSDTQSQIQTSMSVSYKVVRPRSLTLLASSSYI